MNSNAEVQLICGISFVAFCLSIGLFICLGGYTDLGQRCRSYFCDTFVGVFGYYAFRYSLLLVGLVGLLAYAGALTK